MDANLTNSITNALHSGFLLAYFLGALRHRARGLALRRVVIAMFGLLLLIKLLGVWAHWVPAERKFGPVWVAMSVIVLPLHFAVLRSVRAPVAVQAGLVSLAVLATAVFLVDGSGRFVVLAVPLLITNTAAAICTRSSMRTGFALTVLANVVWILARQVGGMLMEGQVPAELRYDNDVYHLMLIGATFVIYKAFVRQAQAEQIRPEPVPVASA